MRYLGIIVTGLSILSACGCSTQTPEISAQDKANFKGKPMTNDQRNAMNASIEEYRRTHTSFPPKPDESPTPNPGKSGETHSPSGG